MRRLDRRAKSRPTQWDVAYSIRIRSPRAQRIIRPTRPSSLQAHSQSPPVPYREPAWCAHRNAPLPVRPAPAIPPWWRRQVRARMPTHRSRAQTRPAKSATTDRSNRCSRRAVRAPHRQSRASVREIAPGHPHFCRLRLTPPSAIRFARPSPVGENSSQGRFGLAAISVCGLA